MNLFEESTKLKIRAQLPWFVLWLGVTTVAFFLNPDSHGHGTHQQLGLPPCPSVLVFNRPCPGCGLTTSWTAFLHGKFDMAFRAHPLGMPMYLGFTVVALCALYGNIKNRRFRIDSDWANRLFIGFVIVFFIYGATRMLTTGNYQTSKEQVWSSAIKGKP